MEICASSDLGVTVPVLRGRRAGGPAPEAPSGAGMGTESGVTAADLGRECGERWGWTWEPGTRHDRGKEPSRGSRLSWELAGAREILTWAKQQKLPSWNLKKKIKKKERNGGR